MCNPFFVYYATHPRKDRLTVLDVFLGGQKKNYRIDDLACDILRGFKISKKIITNLDAKFPKLKNFTEANFNLELELLFPQLGPQQKMRILEAGAISSYNSQSSFPVIKMLVCDDAPQFKLLTSKLSLCWVHEGRHYKKLNPYFDLHKDALENFITEFWEYYDKLLEWQANPAPLKRVELEKEFNNLFGKKTGYEDLDARIKKTNNKKENLLQVLDYPQTPLNNNPAELGARVRVRKRDVSFGPRSPSGLVAWDTFMTISGTAKKLGVSFYKYIYDRISKANKMVSLSDLISTKAQKIFPRFSDRFPECTT